MERFFLCTTYMKNKMYALWITSIASQCPDSATALRTCKISVRAWNCWWCRWEKSCQCWRCWCSSWRSCRWRAPADIEGYRSTSASDSEGDGSTRTSMSRYHIARLHCDARRPFDCCSRCSAMTVDPNCPTSLAGGYAFMNRGVGQKIKFWAHSPVPSARNMTECNKHELFTRFSPKVRSAITCLESQIKNAISRSKLEWKFDQHSVLHLSISIKFRKFTSSFVSLQIFFRLYILYIYIFVTSKFFIINLRSVLFRFCYLVVRDIISLCLIDQPDE